MTRGKGITLLRHEPPVATALAVPADRVPVATHGSLVALPDGRDLGYDEIGDPDGRPVLYFHGFGSSRLIRHPDDDLAREAGVRLICVDRPGIGLSTAKPGRRLLDWPLDVAALAQTLRLDRFGVLGWSGGGPYALACAWAMPERVTVCGLVSGAAPLAGVRKVDYRFPMHRAAAHAAGAAPWVIRLAMWRWARAQRRDPERHLDEAVAKMVEADRVLIGDPRIRAQMLANVGEMLRQGHRGLYDEALIMARPWGFRLADVRVPVRLWHGDDDPSVPVAMGRYVAANVRDCHASFYPGEGHHLLFDRWQEILADLSR